MPGAQGQPPIGSSPVTGPTQNLGAAAKGMQAVSALLSGMAIVMPLVGPATPLGQAINKAIGDIAKHVPPGASTPQGEGNFLKEMMLKQQQMQSQRAAVGAMGGQPGGMPPGGASPMPAPQPQA